jgi:hypothetical protein
MSSDVDCTYLNTDNPAELYQEYIDKTLEKKIKTYCYCYKQFISIGPVDITNLVLTSNGNTFPPCKDWLDLYIKSESLKYGIIILIPLVNFILSVILECNICLIKDFTEFEKNKYLSSNMASNMWKSFILQAINTVRIL